MNLTELNDLCDEGKTLVTRLFDTREYGECSDVKTLYNLFDDIYSLASKQQCGCTCSNDDRHGETTVMCCNNCGKPVEKEWIAGMEEFNKQNKNHE